MINIYDPDKISKTEECITAEEIKKLEDNGCTELSDSALEQVVGAAFPKPSGSQEVERRR